MAVYNKFDQFAQSVLEAKHNFASDVFKVMLTNTAPVAGNSVKSDLVEILEGNGYASGGNDVTITVSSVAGLARVSSVNTVFTATGGTIGPFRYAVFYNSTAVTQPLVSWWDYGSSVTLQDTEIFTVGFDAVNGILDIQ